MSRLSTLTPCLLLLLGCQSNDKTNPWDTGLYEANPGPNAVDTDALPQDTAPEVIPLSDFEDGKYLFETLAMMPAGEGIDLTGDGVVNNAFPGAMDLVNLAISAEDFSFKGVNAQIQGALDSELSVVLLHAIHAEAILNVDVLIGLWDPPGTLTVDPGSYNDDGSAKSSMSGAFSDQTAFTVGPDSLSVPITFMEDYAPFLLTIEGTQLAGTIDSEFVDGAIYGAIPVDTILNEVVDPLIPKEGYNIDFDEELESKEEIMVLVEELALLVADIDLDGDRKGISAAFSFTAEVAEW
jgi:hypothetical protein